MDFHEQAGMKRIGRNKAGIALFLGFAEKELHGLAVALVADDPPQLRQWARSGTISRLPSGRNNRQWLATSVSSVGFAKQHRAHSSVAGHERVFPPLCWRTADRAAFRQSGASQSENTWQHYQGNSCFNNFIHIDFVIPFAFKVMDEFKI